MRLTMTLIIAAILIFVGLRLFSRKLLYFPVRLDRHRADALENVKGQVQERWLTMADQTRVHGWVIEKDLAGLPVIFYFGGNAEEVSLNVEEFLAHVPANVILFNYRGYGKSQGAPREDLLKSDCLAVFDAMARAYNLSPENCLAWGRSLGSSMASWLALERDLGGLILTCPFDSIEAVAAGFYPAWLVAAVLKDRHRTIDFSPRIHSPTLILAAGDDEIIAPERTQALVKSLTCPTEQVIVQGAGHNTVSGFSGYYEVVAEFLGGYLIRATQKKGLTEPIEGG